MKQELVSFSQSEIILHIVYHTHVRAHTHADPHMHWHRHICNDTYLVMWNVYFYLLDEGNYIFYLCLLSAS